MMVPARSRTTVGALLVAATAILLATIARPSDAFVVRHPSTTTSPERWSSTALAKRPPNHRKGDRPPEAEGGGGGEVPANLRRKVTAKRPTLGHVVPKHAKPRQKGGSSDPSLRPQGQARRAGSNNPSNLRVLGGSARGRRLDSPDVYLRPMMGKVREAVFSTLTSFGLYDRGDAPTRHLDIFAGSGSVGLESLSRGATHCTFVDLSRNCCDAVERNLDTCGFADRAAVACRDVYDALAAPDIGAVDVVTLCPPYEEIVYADLLDAVANSPAVRDDTVVLVEYPVELGCLPHVLDRTVEGDEGKLVGVRNRRYGRTVVAFYVANPTGRLRSAESRPEEFVAF